MATLRNKVYQQLESENHTKPTPLDWFLITLIVLNVIAVIIESNRNIYLAYRYYFDGFETFSLIVFSIEYLARIWSIPEKYPYYKPWKARSKWFISLDSIIDLLAILPAMLYFFFPFDLRFLRLLRLLRLLKLARYFAALRILLGVLRREKNAFKAVLLILIVVIIISASSMYVAEHRAQPDVFGTIYESMWWAVVSLTTVGYGDVVPVTAAGKVIGAIITILGIGMAALPAGILASGLADELRSRRQKIEQTFRKMLLDGEIDLNENSQFRRLRKELGISSEHAAEIKEEVLRELQLEKEEEAREETAQRTPVSYNYCPNCGQQLEISIEEKEPPTDQY
ncbi:potassium channel family protein [Cardiobacteriaceae bacterium TAE3-ERU3]|nr:potassium channel family protein [Cardiobacteriaceae bacterium TAE3-ERU3]